MSISQVIFSIEETISKVFTKVFISFVYAFLRNRPWTFFRDQFFTIIEINTPSKVVTELLTRITLSRIEYFNALVAKGIVFNRCQIFFPGNINNILRSNGSLSLALSVVHHSLWRLYIRYGSRVLCTVHGENNLKRQKTQARQKRGHCEQTRHRR